MRFLLDMPVSRDLGEVLRRRGHEAVHASDVGLHRAADEELLEHAHREGHIVVTADLDFPRLLIMSLSTRAGVILFRGGSYSNAGMTALLERVLDAVPPERLARSICVVDRRHVRITELPQPGPGPA